MNNLILLNVFLGVLLTAPGALACLTTCPFVFPTICEFYYEYCYDGYDCAYGFTCCSIRCGHDCIWNSYLTDSSYTDSCPASDSFGETCDSYQDNCNSPGDCEVNEICCLVDSCGTRCMAPEPDSIGGRSDTALPDVRSKSASYIDALLYAAKTSFPSGSKLAQDDKMTKLMGADWVEEVKKNKGRKPGWEERIKKQMEEQMNGE